MGAWGTGPFDNDDACDWESRLPNEGKAAIDGALGVRNLPDLSDDTLCSAAIAACEVVAAANGHPIRGFSKTAAVAAQWLAESGYQPGKRQIARAVKVAQAVAATSALADLWRESGELTGWRRSVTGLVKRLEKPAAAPLPKTKIRAAKTAASVSGKARPTKAPTAEARTVTSRPATSTAARVPPAAVPLSRRTAKQLLIRKAQGMLIDHRQDSVDVMLRSLKALTLKDAATLAALAGVAEIDVSGMNLPPEKRKTLEILLDGWMSATSICASGTTGVVSLLCEKLPALRRVRTVDISHSDVCNDDVRRLSGLGSIRQLSLSWSGVTDAVFDAARDMPSLTQLMLHECEGVTIPAAARFAIAESPRIRLAFSPHRTHLGMAELSPARREACSKRNRPVQQLTYANWKVWVNLHYGHVGFGELPEMDRLQYMAEQCLVDSVSIGLNRSPIRNESAERLRFVITAWPDIRSLTITGSQTLTDSMAREIARLTKLESLAIDEAKIGDQTVAEIAGLRSLRHLRLVGTKITAASLSRIAALPNLRWLQLAVTRGLSPQDLMKLRAKLAGTCYVDW